MESETLYGLFVKAASVHSEEPAVTFDDGSGSSESLSYKHLHTLSAELCGILQKRCLPNKGVIGLYCRENLFIPVWILGIMQTPAAYAPLDPGYPGLLSARVIERCGLMYCLVQIELTEKFQQSLDEYLKLEVCVTLPVFKLTLVRVKSLQRTVQDKQMEQAKPQAVGDTPELKNSLAYVLHTSGTTGLPKIVKVPHHCIYPNIYCLSRLFQIKKGDVVFLASPLTFDPSVVEIFMTLSCGANLLIVPALLKKMPKRLSHLLFKSHKTTVLQATPTLFCRFGSKILKEDLLSADSSLRVLVLGGEPCPTPEQLTTWKHKDNKTHIFNIYGITEVSCWALCHRITQGELLSHQTYVTSTPVPLGDALTGTMMEVQDEHGAVIKEGEGQLFIGGENRVCLLDDEDTVVPGTMRATGDWVRIKDRCMHFIGRKDRIIKRHGHRVNLDTLQQLIAAVPLVESSAVGLHENQRLIAFIVTSKSEDGAASVVVCDAQMREDLDGAGRQVCRAVLQELSQMLAYYNLPDTVVIVPELPLTSHGKVDMKRLMQIYQVHRSGLRCTDFTKKSLESLWKASLGLSKDDPVDENSNFLLCGGDSLRALVLYEDLLSATGLTSPNLLEIILDGTFSDIVKHICEFKLTSQLKNDTKGKPEAKKRLLEKSSEVLAKRKQKICEKPTFKVIKRGSQMMDAHKTLGLQTIGDENKTSGGLKTLSLLWSSDTGRCVDASPVILAEQMNKSTVFIGSHSHRIQALDLDSGCLVWERVLGDRIEASAAVSQCGTLVIVGCYDGGVYFLDVTSGETEWIFKTGDAVKCCPAVDAQTGLILVGSHDGHVYALDPKAQQCVWKHHCGGGAIFSSPFVRPSLRRLYVASLGGRLLCLNVDDGEVLWSYSKEAPFFSSPVGSERHIVVGSADGNIYCFSLTGELMWQFLTQAPVFSSPSLSRDQQQVLCGSHDGHIYSLNISDGSLLWSFKTCGRVYSSPCVFPSALGTKGTLVGLASTDGTVWILDSKTGGKLASHSLPGELFSSPVVHKDLLVIGCRNDHVYCLKLDQE